MSIIPMIFDIADELSRPFSYLDSDYGFQVYPQHMEIRPHHHHRRLLLPRCRKSPYTVAKRSQISSDNNGLVHVGKEGFQVSVDVQQFKPNEITVKTVDNTVVVEAKHEEREDDHGLIYRHFVRKYSLPKGYDSKEVVSTLSSDGILTVKAPAPPEKKAKAKERIIHIQQTGPAIDTIKDNRSNESNAVNGAEECEKSAKMSIE